MTEYTKAGYADFLDDTPWQRCPMTFTDWTTGAPETPESLAYWKGFEAGSEDAFAKAAT